MEHRSFEDAVRYFERNRSQARPKTLRLGLLLQGYPQSLVDAAFGAVYGTPLAGAARRTTLPEMPPPVSPPARLPERSPPHAARRPRGAPLLLGVSVALITTLTLCALALALAYAGQPAVACR